MSLNAHDTVHRLLQCPLHTHIILFRACNICWMCIANVAQPNVCCFKEARPLHSSQWFRLNEDAETSKGNVNEVGSTSMFAFLRCTSHITVAQENLLADSIIIDGKPRHHVASVLRDSAVWQLIICCLFS